MKVNALFVWSAIVLSSFAHGRASLNTPHGHFAIQGSIATAGNFGIGGAYYTDWSEIGLGASGTIINAPEETQIIVPFLFAGFLKHLGSHTFFAYGLDLGTKFGRTLGLRINSNYSIGPYIGLEQELTPHILLTGWIQPYGYEYQRIADISISTNYFFSAGGIALSYLF